MQEKGEGNESKSIHLYSIKGESYSQYVQRYIIYHYPIRKLRIAVDIHTAREICLYYIKKKVKIQIASIKLDKNHITCKVMGAMGNNISAQLELLGTGIDNMI